MGYSKTVTMLISGSPEMWIVASILEKSQQRGSTTGTHTCREPHRARAKEDVFSASFIASKVARGCHPQALLHTECCPA